MKLSVVVHDVRSVHNVGSIFRTADAAGAEKILLCGITPSPIDRFKDVRPDFAKVALGAEKHLAWEMVETTVIAMERLKEDGYEILALEQAKGSVPYCTMRPARDEKIALVVGNEVEGLTPEVLRAADRILEIPMMGKKESLNVAVAFGIVVFHLRFGMII